jgi:uracil-DNA glycosylase family 4
MKQHCSLCDCSVANYFIPTYGRGNHEATIAWISCYAPSKTEYKHGGIFSTDKYTQLTKTFREYGFSNANSYFTHIIKCKLTRAPSQLEIDNCQLNLLKELSMLPNLKLIVLIGKVVFQAFTGKPLADNINIPIYHDYTLIGIPHPHYMVANELEYDLSVIKHLHNLTL